MGREIRRVPKGWEHPRDERGRYKPMFDESYIEALEDWLANHKLWEEGEHSDQKNYPGAKDCKFYAQWADNPPDVNYYNPNKWSEEEAVCYQVYENTSEGTPFSSVFDTLQEVEDWLVKHKGYSKSAAKQLCETGYAPTFSGYMPENSLDAFLKIPEEEQNKAIQKKPADISKEKELKTKKRKGRGL